MTGNMTQRLNVALVGLGFGSCFAEIYQNHPDVETLTLCDANPERLRKHAAETGVTRTAQPRRGPRRPRYRCGPSELRHSRSRPAGDRRAGRGQALRLHRPMATSLDDIRAIIDAKRRAAKTT
jgi:hypothetical protein